MAIMLGALALPSGLVWADEYAWTPIAQATEYTLTGAILIEQAHKQRGRPITLAGIKDANHYTVWIARNQLFQGFASLDTLRAALSVAGATFTLTLHDNRQFLVTPRHDGEGPLAVEPMAAYRTFPLANPGTGSLYFVSAIRLMEV